MDTHSIIDSYFAGTNQLLKDRRYRRPLPSDLEPWYCYVADAGHSILCLLGSEGGEAFAPGVDKLRALVPVPLKAVLRG